MIGAAFEEADRRDPDRIRQRIFLVDGNKQQITAIEDHARERDLLVPILIDYIHVSGYLGKAAAALHPGDPTAAGEWADGQLLRILHGRAKAVAATLRSVAAKTRANARTRHLDSPTWTRPPPTWRTTTPTCATTRHWPPAGPSPPA